MSQNPQFPADLVTSTEGILNEELQFCGLNYIRFQKNEEGGFQILLVWPNSLHY